MANKAYEFGKNPDCFFTTIEDKYQTAFIEYDDSFEMYINMKAKNIPCWWLEEQIPEEMIGKIVEKYKELRQYAKANYPAGKEIVEADWYVAIGRESDPKDYCMGHDEGALDIAYSMEQIIFDRFPILGEKVEASKKAVAELQQKEDTGNSKKLKI